VAMAGGEWRQIAVGMAGGLDIGMGFWWVQCPVIGDANIGIKPELSTEPSRCNSHVQCRQMPTYNISQKLTVHNTSQPQLEIFPSNRISI
jgi:hypothetical protein